ARLSGGPLDKTGVIQGMSGSPVYIDGRLVGAVGLAFSYAKEPIAGIRPIEEMQATNTGDRSLTVAARNGVAGSGVVGNDAGGRHEFGSTKLVEIATPLSFNGFTSATLDHFAPQLRK